MAWLDDVLDATEESESPKQFFYWSALATVSAVLKRNVYIDRFYYTMYPNIYVMLIAKSGMKKGVPVALAKELAARVKGTRIFAGRNSVQGIIAELAGGKTNPDGTITKDACGFMLASEFSSFLVHDPQTLTILTDLYDSNYNAEWANNLKGGREQLKGLALTMLAASNPTHFQESVPKHAMNGGFVARTLLIYGDKRANVNSLMYAPKTRINLDELAKPLIEMTKLKGEISFTDEAKQEYDRWYRAYVQHLDKNQSDDTGTADRLTDNVLKVAMLIAIAREQGLIITTDNIQEAVEHCASFRAGLRSVKHGTGRSDDAPLIREVMERIVSAKDYIAYRSVILQEMMGDLDHITLDRIITTLEEAKLVETIVVKKKTAYTMPADKRQWYDNFKKGEQQ